MNTSQRSRLIPWLVGVAAVLWTLCMALTYAVLAFSDDVANWVNGLFGMSPEVMAWVTTAGAWLEQWGGWLIGVVWAVGMIALLLIGWLANRIVHAFSGDRVGTLT